MRCNLLIALILISPSLTFAQYFLALDVYHTFSMKRMRYYEKEAFTYKLKKSNKKHKGIIRVISDSALVISSKSSIDTVRINDIRMVIVSRANYLTRSFSQAFMGAGPGIIALDAFNNLINKESQIVKPRVVKTGIAIFSAGILLKLFETKRHRVGKRKILKTINISPY